jgi:hypothetical protein
MSSFRNVGWRIQGVGGIRKWAPTRIGRRVGVTLKAAMASVLVVGSALAAVTIFTAGPAGANAANPDPTTTGTVTINPGGTVTVGLSGTWSWVGTGGQDCAGRYGTGWSVDWWGISTSATPSPSFNLTNATIVNPKGTTTTGTVSPDGTAPGTLSGGNLFHVGQFYAGETVNSPTTCTDVTGGSEGAWSAQATYPNLADVPPQLCVNMYDEHGTEGSISDSAKDFDPATNDDNSIHTNDFDPTLGSGFCLATTTTTTQVNNAGPIVLGNGTVTDNVTVTGQSGDGLPTGTVNFYVCGPTNGDAFCTSTATPAGTADLPSNTDTGIVSTGSSSPFTPTGVGTWCFAAVFVPSSGASYAGSGDNQGGTVDSNECIDVTPAPSQTTTQTSTTSSGEGSVVIGPDGSVTDAVTVTGDSVGGVPTGTVSFFVCGPAAANELCTSAGTAEGTPTLSGTGHTSTATSNSFLPTKVGTYCFGAEYNPDSASQYLGSTDNETGDIQNTECFTVTPANTVTTTQTSAASTGQGTVTIGANGSVTDAVTVTGNATAGAPDGTVAFYVCGPAAANALCTSTATAEGTPTLTAATSSTSTATSNSFTPTQAGTYCFAAVYTPGDGSNYLGSTDNVTGTVEANECFAVASPATSPATAAPAAPAPPQTAPAAIAFTGADISALAAGGLVLVGLGGSLVLISRRRRRTVDSVQ